MSAACAAETMPNTETAITRLRIATLQISHFTLERSSRVNLNHWLPRHAD